MIRTLICLMAILVSDSVSAHHVLGRPAYSLSEDSNTPPSMQVETQIGNYYVTYMVYPAFPEPGKQGRLNLYATHRDSGKPFDGQVEFTIRDDRWFGGHRETLGTQNIDDGVYRQGFLINEAGKYIISANFHAQGEPYTIDFPLKIGQDSAIGPIGIAAMAIFSVLVLVNIAQRKRLLRGKIQTAQQDKSLMVMSHPGLPEYLVYLVWAFMLLVSVWALLARVPVKARHAESVPRQDSAHWMAGALPECESMAIIVFENSGSDYLYDSDHRGTAGDPGTGAKPGHGIDLEFVVGRSDYCHFLSGLGLVCHLPMGCDRHLARTPATMEAGQA